MDYSIRPLTPDSANSFADYLSGLDFGHAPHWASCFCRFYYTDCSSEVWQGRTGEENRAEAIETIGAGTMTGYLAFDGDKCIGWCNASDVARFLRLEHDFDHLTKGKKVGCTICYVIHPQYRGQGVARALLHRAVDDFRAEGFDAVLALPVEADAGSGKRYRGTLSMYRELGFQEVARHDALHVMWLELVSHHAGSQRTAD